MTLEWRTCPFGLIKKEGVFKADGLDAEAVIHSYKMAKEGKGPYIISKWLKSASVTTKTNVEWTPRRVRYMLTNPTYAAMQNWKGALYPLIGYDALVSLDDYTYVQSTLFGRENFWRGRERQLLSSILQCPMCSGKMYSRQTGSKKTRRYVCSNKNEHGNCNSPVIDLPSLNDAVLKRIVDISNGRYSKEQISSKLVDDIDETTNVLQQLQNEYNSLEKAIQDVFDDFYIHKKLSEQHYNDLMKRYENRQKEIN